MYEKRNNVLGIALIIVGLVLLVLSLSSCTQKIEIVKTPINIEYIDSLSIEELNIVKIVDNNLITDLNFQNVEVAYKTREDLGYVTIQLFSLNESYWVRTTKENAKLFNKVYKNIKRYQLDAFLMFEHRGEKIKFKIINNGRDLTI